ncbi:glycosyltransferase family 4 protein [Methylomonas sp. MED-D]|uniref:glycosyltransferase family 4 protein n=1 Tax=unclassified Methylomonas TaxID=2608980 RepID=UPI0028A44A2A|nr:glycosyltransferase family 4 protein [Methylomonas sp. MV1]MDT4330097.1 glycosyltransferase family 4 protein [Methylomonas sp. MV1]
MANPKLLYFVTEDWYFCSHRMALAKAARAAGFDISVMTRVTRHGDAIRAAGFELIDLPVDRGGTNPWIELNTLMQVWRAYRHLKPDLVHQVALKPVLYGGIVSLLMPELKTVNLLAGLGTIFSSSHQRAKWLRKVVQPLFSLLFRRPNSQTIVQNRADYALLRDQLRVPESALHLIKGSGVDTDEFRAIPEPPGRVTIALVSRLLWDKGIGEYVAAVGLLKRKGLEFDALLVGSPDHENLAPISQAQLTAWNRQGDVRCVGHVDDVAHFWRDAHIAVLPSFYGEGIPKSLIEAAASGRAIVTTDTPGCDEIVADGENGYLVPVKDVPALATALEKLLTNPALRQAMGLAGRRKVEQEFSDAIVLAQTLAVYRLLLDAAPD